MATDNKAVVVTSQTLIKRTTKVNLGSYDHLVAIN